MRFGFRPARASTTRRRSAFSLRTERLEVRELLTAFDLANIGLAPPKYVGPYGVQEVGSTPSGGVGYSVTDVGDTNGDGYDDFVIGAPTISTANGTLSLGGGSNSKAMLVFGSKAVNLGNIDWATINTFFTAANAPVGLSPSDYFKFLDRTGDLSNLGNTFGNQTNPTFVTSTSNYPFDGLVFSTSNNSTSQLGASVTAVGDINGDGFNDFMIGAPGANDPTGSTPGTGREYLIYGGPNLARGTKTVDLDQPITYGANIITFVNSQTGSKTGFSAGLAGDVITDGFPDIAIGAPGASYNSQSNSGAVYLVSGANLRSARSTTIDLSTIGQTGSGFPGIIYTGASSNDRLGYSVAGNFNFDGDRTSANQQLVDFVMGAPGNGTGNGNAYLAYGATNLLTFPTITNNVTQINVSRFGDPATIGNVPGAIFQGASTGSLAGFSVASAGDFNGDGFGDFMIGAPNAQNGSGAVYLLEGKGTSTTSPRLYGNESLANIPQSVNSITFVGESAGSLTGWSETAVGFQNADRINEIALGAPGLNGNSGAVYVIPGNTGLSGTVSLSTTSSSQIAGNVLTVSGSILPAFLGSSVSGRLTVAGQQRTLDNDLVGDLIVGAAGYSLQTPGQNNSSRNNGGSVFALEGRFLPLGTPTSSSIAIGGLGVGSPTGPFVINAAAPAALDIYIFSNASSNPVFRPVTQINPTTITVNGVAYAGATIRADTVDRNGDGIADAIVTITPRSNLNLSNGTSTFTVSGRTLAAAGNLRFTGNALVTVTGGGGGGGGGGATSSIPIGAQAVTTFIGPNGDSLVPTIASLSAYSNYKPLPLAVAINQFLPDPAFTSRNYAVAHGKALSTGQGITSTHNSAPNGVHTLGKHVFTRGKFHPGKRIEFTHKVRVVPASEQHQVF